MVVSPSVEARECKGKSGKSGLCDVTTKQAHFVLKNQDELELTEEQVTQIMIIKADAKKDAIQRQAELDIIDVDIRSQLWENEINEEEVLTLVTKKCQVLEAKQKTAVQSYISLKGILTGEQKEQVKQLQRTKKKDSSHLPSHKKSIRETE